jgi:hypothetical protein
LHYSNADEISNAIIEKPEEVYRAFRKAIKIASGFIASWISLGAVLIMRGLNTYINIMRQAEQF